MKIIPAFTFILTIFCVPLVSQAQSLGLVHPRGAEAVVLDRAPAKTPVAGKVMHLNKADFMQWVVDFKKSPGVWNYIGDKPCVIDFYASWCPPCKLLSPLLEEMAKEYKDLYIYKIDIDMERELANLFGITSVPTIVFVPMQGQPSVAYGLQPKAELRKQISSVLAKP